MSSGSQRFNANGEHVELAELYKREKFQRGSQGPIYGVVLLKNSFKSRLPYRPQFFGRVAQRGNAPERRTAWCLIAYFRPLVLYTNGTFDIYINFDQFRISRRQRVDCPICPCKKE